MSARVHTRSTRSRSSKTSERLQASTPYPRDDEPTLPFDACAATASFFLYAQFNVVVVLHHDTLAVERKFEGHKEDVSLIAVDNASERGGGRQVVSYDSGQNAIVWDLFTGNETARFASYEHIHCAAWMRDGSVAFGNDQGNIILFEPGTEEHLSTRTIFDPVMAIAPASDCRTFAIGYKNGSILVATVQTTFTILYTLTTSRPPAPITGLQWHGSSSKQKTDMLATQTSDGDIRVWSVSKAANSEPPRVIRTIGSPEISKTSRNWFAWSKNGRIVNHSDGDTRSWDVRTKKMTYDTVPSIDNVIAITNYGPSAALFTVGRNHTVQQYDLLHNESPMMVANVQHVPPNAPPTPPDSIEEQKLPRTVPLKILSSEPAALPIELDPETSEDEAVLSPLQKIAKEMDDLEEEKRDFLAPLSPISSRASMSSASSYGRPRRGVRTPPRAPSSSSQGTTFSRPSSAQSSIRESLSIRTDTSTASSGFVNPASRKETMRSPDESKQMKLMDLFPFTKARLSDVKFRTPVYPQQDVTSDVLRREMLSVVFGWPHDIESLIRDELSRHRIGSASGVILSKWLGDSGADAMASLVASESMTSADWMLLALTVNMGQGPQKQIGEAFVRRSLEANEIHPAVAILLGLGSQNEAIEVYVSRKYYLEAILLTCLVFPHDWQRQSHLVRKWGEVAVSEGQVELAVRCFSCTGLESSEPWFSPNSQDMVYQAQQRILAPDTTSPPLSPPSATSSNRMTTKNASLKLITSFGDKGVPKQPRETNPLGDTPIANTAITPGAGPWQRSDSRGLRDQSQTRTATPGGVKRARLPSATRKGPADDTPVPNGLGQLRRLTPGLTDGEDPHTAIENGLSINNIPSPNPLAFQNIRDRSKSRPRAESKDRNPHGLHLDMIETREAEGFPSPNTSVASVASRGRHRRSNSGVSRTRQVGSAPDDELVSPSLATGNSVKSFKGRSIDRYIDSLEQANIQAQQRAESRERRSLSRPRNRETSQSRTGTDVAYIKPSKRSPSSPKSMTAEDAGIFTAARESEPRKTYGLASPVDSKAGGLRSSSRTSAARPRAESPEAKLTGRSTSRTASRNASRGINRQDTPDVDNSLYGEVNRPASRNANRVLNRQDPPDVKHSSDTEANRTASRNTNPVTNRQPMPDLENSYYTEANRSLRGRQSPPSPAPMESEPVARSRQRSTSRPVTESRARSTSRRPKDRPVDELSTQQPSEIPTDGRSSARPRALSRKELAAKELEDRRMSLARRTPIPAPGDYSGSAPVSPQISHPVETFSSKNFVDSYFGIERSQTVDPEVLKRFTSHGISGISTSSVPIGLPATPRAMRHPKDMDFGAESARSIPAVPALPEHLTKLAPVTLYSDTQAIDDLGPLLPSTVYGQKPPMTRSASAPAEEFMRNSMVSNAVEQRNDSSRRDPSTSRSPAQSYQISERDFAKVQQSPTGEPASIAARLSQNSRDSNGATIIIVGEEHSEAPPPVLAELAHLADPPPPPPPPSAPTPGLMYPPAAEIIDPGVISIAMDVGRGTNTSSAHYPAASDDIGSSRQYNGATGGRSRHGSMDSSIPKSGSSSTSSSSKWRNVTDRMRSGSRQRKSPINETTSPYQSLNSEVILPLAPSTRSKSPHQPYETTYDMGVPPLPNQGNPSFSVYRTPKEIRANMPPDSLQHGVYQSSPSSAHPGDEHSGMIEGGMI